MIWNQVPNSGFMQRFYVDCMSPYSVCPMRTEERETKYSMLKDSLHCREVPIVFNGLIGDSVIETRVIYRFTGSSFQI
jgi:hypothetical protein